jgi:hypothetical protein
MAQGQPIITFKEFENSFDNVAATFGGLAGIDALGGKNMTVIGTPHWHPNAYLLLASALGVEIQAQDYEGLSACVVRRNGYEFVIMTYRSNLALREVQLHLIESDLIQAIGRARLVRNDCRVTVMSNFPIVGATFLEKPCKEGRKPAWTIDEVIPLSSVTPRAA